MNVEQKQQALINEIIHAMSKNTMHRITFYDYMKMALYYPELGYYTKDKLKIGKNADFYTSTSVGSVFGKTIANHFVELLPYTKNGEGYSILEMGGGDGRLARDVLNEMKKKHIGIYEKLTYYMLETSPYHKNIQHDNLKHHINHVIWINDVKELPSPFEGVIFSNELVDAFPVHKVIQRNGKLQEIYVSWDEQESTFEEIVDELSNEQLETYFKEQDIILKEGQIAEINLEAKQWMQTVGEKLHRGYIVTIDYGYPAEELYASHRHEGTVMCYYHHLANDNPYQNIGEQDITTHVNFTALQNIGEQVRLETIWFTTQSHFLLNNGILNYLHEIELESMEKRDLFQDEALKINRAIRQLITPGEMGETFKVLVQQKNVGKQSYRFLTEVWKQYGM